MSVKGALEGEAFETHIQHFLFLNLERGQIIVMYREDFPYVLSCPNPLRREPLRIRPHRMWIARISPLWETRRTGTSLEILTDSMRTITA